MKILFLTLKKDPFDVTLTGEKKIEYRRKSAWIDSRLINKKYDVIKFTNGYSKNKPWMIVEFKGWKHTKKAVHKYSNGLIVDVNDGDYEIQMGRILEVGNINE